MSSNVTSAPVNGKVFGVLTTFSPCTVGFFVVFSPRTLEQKLFAAVGTQAVPGLLLSQPAAFGLVVQFPPFSLWQPEAVGLVVQSPPLLCVHPAAVGFVVQSLVCVHPAAVGFVVQSDVGGVQTPLTTVLGGVQTGGWVGLHPVCAGLLRPMPWLRSHS